jgi:long-chain acyl-CoA synthetase
MELQPVLDVSTPLNVPSALPASDSKDSWKDFWRLNFPCDEPGEVPYPRIPLSGLMESTAKRFPKHPACTLYGRPTSYETLNDQARRLARALSEMGACRGQHVGLLLPNIPEYLAALQATWLTGATALQLSPLMVAEEIGHWLEATGCRIVITLDLLAPAVVRSLDKGPLEHLVLTSLARRMAMWRGMLYRVERYRRNGYLYLPKDARRHRFDDLLKSEPLTEKPAVNPAEDVAVLAPTGGTTASPKAVMLTHQNLVSNAMQLLNWWGGSGGNESILGVLPFFHSYGLCVTVLTAWAKGSTVHLHPRFEARAVMNLIERERPALIPAVPAMLSALNNVMRGKKHDWSFVRSVLSGASALPESVWKEFKGWGVQELVEGYGLTECSPVTHANPPAPRSRLGSIGLPLADTQAKLVDPDTGKLLGDGEVGELVIKGPQVMKGYFNNPQATEAVLKDGWLFTGDMARRESDGFYFIVDRKRDIIKTSGFLVFPAEVEEVLRSYPDVLEAAVVGVPDVQRGEIVKALVVPRSGSKLQKAELEEHCKAHLGKHKRPREIEIVSELPKNFLGKVLRRKIREMPAPATEPPA